MAISILADAHIGGPGGPPDRLVEQLRSLPERGCRRLIFLGDLFHVWVGDRRFETPEIRTVLDVLPALRDSGLELSYVEGNRDFFLDDGPYAEYFDEVGDEVAFEAGGKRFLAVHGDGLDEKDWRYRFWRRLSKSRPSRFFARRLPGGLARRMVHGTEARLAKTNFKHKVHVPEGVLRSYGERRLREGYDVLLLGHFHEPRTYELDAGEVRIVDAWFNNRSLEWIEE